MRALLVAVGAVLLTSCALLGKSEPLVPRYFSPEYDGDPSAQRAPPGLQLRLGQVQGWTHLRERLVIREPTSELTFREDWRWTERPEVYLRRALERTLFEERGLVAVVSGRAPTLDVELLAFEVLTGPRRARLQLSMLLRDDRVALLVETVTVEQAVAQGGQGDAAEALTAAFAGALRTGVNRLADRVVERLVARASEVAVPATRPN